MRSRSLTRGAIWMALWALLALVSDQSVRAAEFRSVAAMQKSGTEVTLLSVYFQTVGVGWAVGAGGAILRTADGGKRWRPVSSGTTVLLTNVSFADA